MSAYREIFVTVLDAQELRDVRIFGGKMSPYAVAWIHSDMAESSHVDIKGGIFPRWNAKLRLLCEESRFEEENAIIHVDLFDSSSHSFHHRQIGTVAFALSKLPGRKPQSKRLTTEAVFLSLPVLRSSGREQGTLNISVRIGEISDQPAPNKEQKFDNDAMSDAPIDGSRGTPDLGGSNHIKVH